MKPMKLDELAPLTAQFLKPGVRTNVFLSAAELSAQIEHGELEILPFYGGMWLLSDRGEFSQLRFYLEREAKLCPIESEKPIVAETAHRIGDPDIDAVCAQLESIGFVRAFDRVRLKRLPGELPPSVEVDEIAPSSEDALALMNRCFDALTGCIPTRDALVKTIASGNLLAAYREGKLAGILHVEPSKASSELRHLAVAPEFRRSGVASELIVRYLAKFPGKSTVWVRSDNLPAMKLYEKFGWTGDRLGSVVMIKLPQEK